MNKRFNTTFVTILAVILFFISNNIQGISTMNSPLDHETIYVDVDNTAGPWDGSFEFPYRRIKDAIETATALDTIFVFEGIYNESIVIGKPLTIIGENRNNTIIDGTYEDVVISVTEDYVTIQNFTIRNSGGYMDNAGIKVHSKHNHIKDCTVYRTKTGIYVDTTTSNVIQNCTFHTNGEGIFLKSSSDITIQDCCFVHNAIGLHLQNTSWSDIRNSHAHTNSIGYLFSESSHIDISHCAIYNNNDNSGGIFLDYCTYITITNSLLRHNGVGIKIKGSSFLWITLCDISWNTHDAAYITDQSRDIIFSGCNIEYNFRYGIYVKDESYCTLQWNNFYKNTLYGVFCETSYCTAKNNWWGSVIGPSFTEIGLGDRVTSKYRSPRFIPWLSLPLQNIGTGLQYSDICNEINIPTTRYSPIEIEGTDTDSDGAPNWWEEKYSYNPETWNNHTHLDPDNDGLNNIEECFTDQWGSDPFQKDIFLEFDWMQRNPSAPSNKPSDSLIQELIDIFANYDINFHVDTGALGGGEQIPYQSNFSYADLRDLYWNYFLHNDLNNPRKGIFHYGLVCDYGPGPGFSFVGWDHLDSFDISAQMLQENQPKFDRDRLIIGGSVHELGHTLGLFVDDHGGNDNMEAANFLSRQWWKYRNYKSCMNYYYTYKTLSYSDGSHGLGDFDDWGTLDFYFFKDTHFEWPKE